MKTKRKVYLAYQCYGGANGDEELIDVFSTKKKAMKWRKDSKPSIFFIRKIRGKIVK